MAASIRPAQRPRRGPAAPPTGRANLWIPLGPATVLGGQAVGAPRVAGRVNALAISDDGLRVYAASANGGVWFSGDAGGSWRALGGFVGQARTELDRPAHRHATGTIAVRPGGTLATDDVFVGTGEPYHFPLGMVTAQAGLTRGGVGILVGHGPANDPADNNPWVREAPNLAEDAVSKIALQPGAGAGVVAATTKGLFERPIPAGLNVNWNPVSGTPFNSVTTNCSDVLWTPAIGATPERLWVWVQDGLNAGLWVRDAGSTNFRNVATPGFANTRGALAASTPANQVWLLNDQGGGNAPLLFRIASTSAALPVATQVVNGVADFLNGFGFWDLAITVHPAFPNRVYLGGNSTPAVAPDTTALINQGRTDDAAVIWADVANNLAGQLTFGFPNPPIMVGVGVHADVHDVRFSNPGPRLWVGCDGGVFRSDNPIAQVGFFPCNNGLSIVESNYLAAHPVCEGFVTVGLQDNGVITRLSSTVWRNAGLGDGGGIVLDPLQPDRWFRQYFNGDWDASDGSIADFRNLYRRVGPPPGFVVTFHAAESTAAAFYSTPAAIGHRRGLVPPPNPNVRQLIVGTNRLWYSENFGQTWVTLPGGGDPLAALPPNFLTDGVDEAITVCRWDTPNVAWVLTNSQVWRYERAAGSDNGGGIGNWTRVRLANRAVGGKKDRKSPTGPMRSAAVWTDLAVNEEAPRRGPWGSVYVGTIGDPDDEDVDTLWWFDGTRDWHPTGLRNHSLGVPAPVTVICCDPAHPEEVWVGTTVGVWRGIRTLHDPNPPTWEWLPRVNGLPEASVEDLAIFTDGALRLVRAAIASRGVWELRLDADVEDGGRTYLRAHDDDLRYRASSSTTQRNGQPNRSWHGSPDVRPRVASAAVPAPGAAWQRGAFGGNTERLRRFQAAMRSNTGDPRVRATGVWDDYFNEVLRANGAPILPSPPNPANTVGITNNPPGRFWDTQMTAPHSTRDPWGLGRPTEEDLYELTPQLVEGTLLRTSCRIPSADCRVDVVIHHRGLDSRPGADVRVTLLRWIDIRPALPPPGRARPNNSANWVPGNVPWAPAVNNLLNNGVAPPSLNLGGGWRFAETNAANITRTLAGQTLDNTRSGVVTFNLNLSGLLRNTVVILAAVLRAGDNDPANDINLVNDTLRNMVLNNPNVAVRSIRVGI